jgi:hypothetical protein
MHLKLKVLLLISGLLIFNQPTLGWAMHLGTLTLGHPEGDAPRAAEDIKNTLHNLGDSVPGFDNPNFVPGTASSNEVCVFCHTPHGANNTVTNAPPLWNRQLPSGPYIIYGGANFDAINSGQPQGVSLACLSCHDGSVAVDALINMSGSGGFKTYTPATADFLGATALIDAGGTMTEVNRSDTGPNYGTITGGGQPFPNLTTDLSDDHPISMEIPSGDPQFDSLLANSPVADSSGLRLLTRTGTVNADKRDSLRSYPGAARTAGAGFYIECASCHNPHTPRPLFLRLPSRYDSALALVSGGGTTTEAQMGAGSGTGRIADNPNAGSLICISCHQK